MKTKKYFLISNKRIALLAMLLALNIICSLISQYVLAPLAIQGIFAFSITLWTIVVVYLAINEFYAVIFLVITEFFRMAFGQDLISTVALILSDLTFLLVMMLVVYLERLITNKKVKQNKNFMLIALITGMVLSMLITSAMDIVYNRCFLLEWWGYKKQEIHSWLLIMILWFNIANIAINIAIVVIAYRPTSVLARKSQTSNTLH